MFRILIQHFFLLSVHINAIVDVKASFEFTPYGPPIYLGLKGATTGVSWKLKWRDEYTNEESSFFELSNFLLHKWFVRAGKYIELKDWACHPSTKWLENGFKYKSIIVKTKYKYCWLEYLMRNHSISYFCLIYLAI